MRSQPSPEDYQNKLEALKKAAQDAYHAAIGIKFSLPSNPFIEEVYCTICNHWHKAVHDLYSQIKCNNCNQVVGWLDYNGYPITNSPLITEEGKPHIYETVRMRFRIQFRE